MSHNVDMFDGTIRHQQAIFMFKILPILRRAFYCLFHERRIFRMNPLENKFNRRYRGSVVLEDSKGFLRPDDLAGGRSPAEAPGTTEPLSFSQIRLTTPHVVVGGRQLSGPLGDSLFEHLRDPPLLTGALGVLQSNSGLVGRDTQEEPFDFGREICSPRASYQHADFVVKAQRERRDRDFTLSRRIWNYAPRGGLVRRQPAVESFTELLRLNGGMPVITQPDHLDWRTITRVVQPRIREIEAQHGEEHVEQSAENLG